MSAPEKQDSGQILQVQSFSTHDGDGIRTVIFFMGCPLRCRWCANPETWTKEPKLAFYRHKCKGCSACAAACKKGLDPRLGGLSACFGCDDCVQACPNRALAWLGCTAAVESIVTKILRDEPFYRYSGGGVTFSGGEPTAQSAFLRALAEALDACGIDMWLETSGFFSYGDVGDILKRLSHVFIDIKLMDDTLHRAYTGKSNGAVLENAKMIYNDGIPLTVRIPCIPGVNLTQQNMEQTAAFMRRHLQRADIELLPYHRLGEDKYPAIGLAEEAHAFSVPGGSEMERAAQWLKAGGANIVSYL